MRQQSDISSRVFCCTTALTNAIRSSRNLQQPLR